MKLHIIYHDGSYDEGTHDEIRARRGDRMSASAVELRDERELPQEFRDARVRSRETPEEKAARLAALPIEALAEELLKRRDADVIRVLAEKTTAEVAVRESDPKAVRTMSGAMVAEEGVPTAPPAPVEERREWWLVRIWRRSVGSAPRWMQVPLLVFAVVLALGVPAAWIWGAVVGDGSEGPTWVGSVATDGVVCPSMAALPGETERWGAGALDLQTEAGWKREAPSALVGPCDGPPEGGVTQIRRRGDLVEGYPDDPTRKAVAVTLRASGTGPVLSAVIYAEPGASWCSVRHELAHAQLGLGVQTPEREGHATAATSILYGSTYDPSAECGDSWDLLQRSLYPEVPDVTSP